MNCKKRLSLDSIYIALSEPSIVSFFNDGYLTSEITQWEDVKQSAECYFKSDPLAFLGIHGPSRRHLADLFDLHLNIVSVYSDNDGVPLNSIAKGVFRSIELLVPDCMNNADLARSLEMLFYCRVKNKKILLPGIRIAKVKGKRTPVLTTMPLRPDSWVRPIMSFVNSVVYVGLFLYLSLNPMGDPPRGNLSYFRKKNCSLWEKSSVFEGDRTQTCRLQRETVDSDGVASYWLGNNVTNNANYLAFMLMIVGAFVLFVEVLISLMPIFQDPRSTVVLPRGKSVKVVNTDTDRHDLLGNEHDGMYSDPQLSGFGLLVLLPGVLESQLSLYDSTVSNREYPFCDNENWKVPLAHFQCRLGEISHDNGQKHSNPALDTMFFRSTKLREQARRVNSCRSNIEYCYYGLIRFDESIQINGRSYLLFNLIVGSLCHSDTVYYTTAILNRLQEKISWQTIKRDYFSDPQWASIFQDEMFDDKMMHIGIMSPMFRSFIVMLSNEHDGFFTSENLDKLWDQYFLYLKSDYEAQIRSIVLSYFSVFLTQKERFLAYDA